MRQVNRRRRCILGGGAAAASLFLPLPYALVRAQSDGTVKLVRAPKVALVLGNASYRSVPALRNPANDANAIADVLRGFGFVVTLLQDADRAGMDAAIAMHARRLAEGRGVGVFYYAGHGLQLSWTNFLIPVDASVRKAEDVHRSCVDLSTLMDGVRRAANPMNLIILDACRDNPFERDFRVTNKGLTQMDAPNDTLLAYATAPGNVASDGDGANGLYTDSLIREIRTPETRVEDVFKRVRLNVRRRTGGAQVPWESTSLEEDFWFLPPPAVVTAAEASARQEAEERQRREAEERARREAEARARAETEAKLAAEAQRVAEAEAERKARVEARAKGERDERDSADGERRFREELARWEGIKGSRNPDDFYAFLLERPSGYIAEQAQFRLDQLEKPRVQVQAGRDGVKPLASGTNRYATGDEFTWDFTDRLKNVSERRMTRVTYADDDRVEFDGGSSVSDQMGNILRNRFGTKNPGVMKVPADIAVGRRWRSAFTNAQPNGVVATNYWDFRVEALEEIALPAGNLRAFRVVGSGESRGPGGQTIMAQTYWVDPTTMLQVRWEEKHHFMSGPRVRTTVDYSQRLVGIVRVAR